MSKTNLIKPRCLLCRKLILNGKCITTTICVASKKSLQTVIEYLASLTKTKLAIFRGDEICSDCYQQIIEYDELYLNLLIKQRKLMKLVQKGGILHIDEPDLEEECKEDMCTMRELNDENFFDDIEISDDEIERTVDVALGRNKITANNHTLINTRPTTPESSSGMNFSCSQCAMRFNCKNNMKKHMLDIHKKYGCELCNYVNTNEDYIRLHMNVHEGRHENQCRFCNKIFTRKVSTIRHMEMHYNTKKYQCDKCGLCFSQTTVLYNHKLQHEAEEKPLNCSICNQIFKTKRTYRHHMITHREDRPRYNCEYCEKTFTEKYTLKVHKRTHAVYTEEMLPTTKNIIIADSGGETLIVNAITEAKHSCIICCRQFTTKDQQNKHMEKEHDVILKTFSITSLEGEEKKPCNICGHMFSTQNNLDLHMKDVHDAVVYQ